MGSEERPAAAAAAAEEAEEAAAPPAHLHVCGAWTLYEWHVLTDGTPGRALAALAAQNWKRGPCGGLAWASRVQAATWHISWRSVAASLCFFFFL